MCLVCVQKFRYLLNYVLIPLSFLRLLLPLPPLQSYLPTSLPTPFLPLRTSLPRPLAYLLALILHPMMLAGWQVYPFLFCPCQSFVLLWLVVYVVCGWGEKCCCLSLVLLILRSYNLAFIHSFMRASIRLIWYRCQGDREGEGTGGRRGRRKPS